ncbi:MAG: RDD family protein [Actinomycetota bacterium]
MSSQAPSPAVRTILRVGRAMLLFFEFGYYYFATVSLLILASGDGDTTFAVVTLVGALILGGALTAIRRRIVGYRLPLPEATTEQRLRTAGNVSLLAGVLLVTVGGSVLAGGLGGGGAVLIVVSLPLLAAALIVRARPVETPPDPELSAVGRRLWARAIDLVVLWPLTFLVAVARDALVGSPSAQAGILNGGVVAGVVLYELCALALFGGSLGKTITGIRVVPVVGSELGWGRALVRTIVFVVSISLGPFASLFLFFPYMDPKRRALHDRLAGSLVPLVDPPPALQ